MRVENLGNIVAATGKFRNNAFARNPWDLQVFDGKLFIGSGDSGNNVGPVFIAALDLTTGTFGHEGEIPEEQIDSFQVIDGSLCIPGHDPHAVKEGPGFYRRGDGWERIPIGKAKHIYSLSSLDGALYASMGAANNGGVFASSVDEVTWTRYEQVIADRHYHNFAFQGLVYSFGQLPFDYRIAARQAAKSAPPYNVLTWSSIEAPSLTHRTDLDVKTLFPSYTKATPGFTKSSVHKVGRSVPFGDAMLILGGTRDGDHNTRYHSASMVRSLTRGALDIRGIPLGTRRPSDLLVRGDRAYMLTNRPGFIEVLETADGILWNTRLEIPTATFARSFEEHDGAFLLGLGTDFNTQSPFSGDILRVTP